MLLSVDLTMVLGSFVSSDAGRLDYFFTSQNQTMISLIPLSKSQIALIKANRHQESLNKTAKITAFQPNQLQPVGFLPSHREISQRLDAT